MLNWHFASYNALELMSSVNVQEVESWLSKLQEKDAKERHRAALVLGGLMPEDKWPIQPLVQALSSDNEDLVFWAIVALGRLGAHAKPAVESIVNIAKNHEAFGVRQTALTALRSIGPEVAAARAAIFAAFFDESSFVRREALQSSIAVPALTPDELAQIAAMSADVDEAVAAWSGVALRNIRVREEGNNAL